MKWRFSLLTPYPGPGVFWRLRGMKGDTHGNPPGPNYNLLVKVARGVFQFGVLKQP